MAGLRTRKGFRPNGFVRSAALALAFVAVFAVPLAAVHPTTALRTTHTPTASTSGPAYRPQSGGGWDLTASATPGAVCPDGSTNCTAGTGVSRVTLGLRSPGTATLAVWPNVQVMFLLELMNYDGVYDTSDSIDGPDPCSVRSPYTLCEESNGVPYFVHNASQIAASIQAAHPGSNVSFALATFGPSAAYDDGDGYRYYVAVPNFTANASTFGQLTSNAMIGNTSTGQVGLLQSNYEGADDDASDNELASSSITALYGALLGSGFAWSSTSHHVVVVLGSAAPGDPNYPVDFCLLFNTGGSTKCPQYQSSCEPAFNFSFGALPKCEGWVVSQNSSSPNASIAGAAGSAPTCTGSLGGNCTVYTIDLNTTPTDPHSKGWPTGIKSGGPGSAGVTNLSGHILRAGCDLANATGGSWDGPTWFTCPNNVTGTLNASNRSNPFVNPSLGAALAHVSLGSPTHFEGVHGVPMFRYVPGPHVALASSLSSTVTCLRGGVAYPACASVPEVVRVDGLSTLAWNWSTNAASNFLLAGDSWQASFDVTFNGPSGTDSLDQCAGAGCVTTNATSLISGFTYAGRGGSAAVLSFPLATVEVEPSFPLDAAVVTPTPSLVAPATTMFGVAATGGVGPYTATWSFGDGSPRTSGWSVDHFFADAGNYSVSVKVTDQLGQTYSATGLVEVMAPVDTLTVVVSADRQVDTVGRPVLLSASVIGGDGNTTVGWVGLPAGCVAGDLDSLTCTPSTPGSYAVAATVTDGAGGAASGSIALLVNPAPVVILTAHGPAGGCGGPPAAVAFSAVTNGGSAPFSYEWSFGDGGQSTGNATISHLFATGAARTASVTITDAVGATAVGRMTATSPTSTACSAIGPTTGNAMVVPMAGIAIVGAIVAAGAVVAFLARRERR